MAISLDKLETAEAWCDAVDFKVDIHIQQMTTKDPVKRKKLKNLYKKAERICDRLAKQLCSPN